jgi:hypothetical protein
MSRKKMETAEIKADRVLVEARAMIVLRASASIYL